MTAPATVANAATPIANFGDTLTRSQRLTYVLMLGALVALGPFTIDLYLPAFPSVVADLATSDAAVQLTLTATTIGFGLGQLIVGPLSDAMGRKRPLLTATSVHVLASIAVAAAPNVELVMAGRILQGMGAAGGSVVAMAVVRDLFGGQRLIRMLSRLALVTGLAPVVAPVIGSQLLRVMEWRGIFIFLAVYGLVVTAIASFVLVETLPHEGRGRFSGAAVARRYRGLVTDPTFIGIAIVGAATFTTLFSYLSASSFVFQEIYGLSAQQFGLIFGINSIGIMAGTQISARLMRRLAPRIVTAIGLAIMSLGAVALLISSLFDVGLLGVVIPLFFVIAPAGIVMPTVQVMALADHGTEAGTAAALIGAANMGVAGAVSPLVGVGGNTPTAMAVVMLGALAVGQLSLWLVVRRRSSAQVLV